MDEKASARVEHSQRIDTLLSIMPASDTNHTKSNHALHATKSPPSAEFSLKGMCDELAGTARRFHRHKIHDTCTL